MTLHFGLKNRISSLENSSGSGGNASSAENIDVSNLTVENRILFNNINNVIPPYGILFNSQSLNVQMYHLLQLKNLEIKMKLLNFIQIQPFLLNILILLQM